MGCNVLFSILALGALGSSYSSSNLRLPLLTSPPFSNALITIFLLISLFLFSPFFRCCHAHSAAVLLHASGPLVRLHLVQHRPRGLGKSAHLQLALEAGLRHAGQCVLFLSIFVCLLLLIIRTEPEFAFFFIPVWTLIEEHYTILLCSWCDGCRCCYYFSFSFVSALFGFSLPSFSLSFLHSLSLSQLISNSAFN